LLLGPSSLLVIIYFVSSSTKKFVHCCSVA
jgi:hypothetical protein